MKRVWVGIICGAILVGLGAWGMVNLTGCSYSPSRRYNKLDFKGSGRGRVASGYYDTLPALAPGKAHGGTANVNGAAFDAMFFKNYGVNPFVDTDEDDLSTLAVDVDTGSYTMARSYLGRGHLPPAKSVRVEEFINYFDYGYAPPESAAEGFAIHLAAAPSRFGAGKMLLRVGLKAREIDASNRKLAVLTFVIDITGRVYQKDRGGRPVNEYPDVEAGGWIPVGEE